MSRYGLTARRKGTRSKELNIYDVSWWATLAINNIREKEERE